MFVTVKSNAKINLGLNIIGKNNKNYHLLDMIMVPISLSDTLNIEFKEKKGYLEIKTNISNIPVDENNIIFKIYNLFYSETKLEKEEIKVYLEKVIPSQSGLGGGSSNGAFFFNELNKYHNYPISLERAIDITKDVGADIPFFLVNMPARVGGIGEKLKIIENNIKDEIILIKPNFGVSTVIAYENYNKLVYKKNAHIDKIIEGMKLGKIEVIEDVLENHLEQALLLEDKNIKKFRKKLENIDNIKFYMSGSGSCYYVFVKKGDRDLVYEGLKNKLKNCEIKISSFLGSN